MPKISVMMPAYNAEKFISQALDSILLQDFNDFQIVVTDDASTDGTAEIIRSYQSRYPEQILAIFNPSNIGVTANCNLALEHCVGEYVSLFAGDDVMLPGKFSKQVAYMEADTDCVLCYHPVEIFDSDTDKTIFVTNQHQREDVFSTEDLLLKGGIPGGCSIMVRRSAIPVGGYDSRLRTVSDWLFFLEISMQGKICKIDNVLARYRKHAGGASQQTYALLAESLKALDIFEEKYFSYPNVCAFLPQAKARYIAGEAFRQLVNDPTLAMKLAADALLHKKKIGYVVLHCVAIFGAYFPGGKSLLRISLGRAKYIIKRFLA